MVCARTVLLHAAAELSEHEDHHLLIGMVLLQIMVEGTDSAGYIIPQFGEGDVLVGVGIEGAWVHTGVQNPGAEVRQMHLGDVLQPLRKEVAVVFLGGGVHLRCRGEDVGAFQGIQAGLGQVIIHRAGADRGRVRSGEDLQGFRPLVFTLDAGQHPVGLQVAYRGHRHAGGGKGSGKAAAKVDGGQDVLLVGVQVTDGPAQPAIGNHFCGLGGMPDIHRAEVGANGVGIADTLQDGYFPLVVQRLKRRHSRVKPDLVIDGQDLLRLHFQHRPVVHI